MISSNITTFDGPRTANSPSSRGHDQKQMCHFVRSLFIGIVVLIIQLSRKGLLHARPSGPEVLSVCPTTDVPGPQPAGRNLIYDHKPLYWLDVSSASNAGYIPGNTYTFYVYAQDPSHSFIDAVLSTSSEDLTCSSGSFLADSEAYRQKPNCPNVVSKSKRSKENRFAFHWTAPLCGCVVVRALVKSDADVYYTDGTQGPWGHLTKRVCPQTVSSILSQMDQNERIDLLCKVMNVTEISRLSVTSDFLRRRDISSQDLTYLARDSLQIHMESRVFQIKQCCAEAGTARLDCIGDIRRHRIDHFCSNMQPDIPFTSGRHEYMMERRDECCWRLGERRYRCFSLSMPGASEARYQTHAGDALSDRTNQVFVYNDESDPVNDLEDFRTAFEQEISTNTEERHTPVVMKPKSLHKSAFAHAQVAMQEVADQHPPVQQKAQQPRTNPEDDSRRASPTSEPVVPVTETMKDLEEKIKRMRVKHDCCFNGKEFMAQGLFTTAWGACERAAREYTNSVEGLARKFRSKCRSFFQRCCMEQYQTSFQQPEVVEGSTSADLSDVTAHAQPTYSETDVTVDADDKIDDDVEEEDDVDEVEGEDGNEDGEYDDDGDATENLDKDSNSEIPSEQSETSTDDGESNDQSLTKEGSSLTNGKEKPTPRSSSEKRQRGTKNRRRNRKGRRKNRRRLRSKNV